jgi:hypothetical protein
MAQNKDRTYQDDGLYNDFIDLIDQPAIVNTFRKSRTYYPHRVCVHSVQGQATSSVTTTWAVAWTPILATDMVVCQQITMATVAYIAYQTINASTGFTVVYNTAPGIGTFDWAVFRLVSALT